MICIQMEVSPVVGTCGAAGAVSKFQSFKHSEVVLTRDILIIDPDQQIRYGCLPVTYVSSCK